jgi:hypothetical protein
VVPGALAGIEAILACLVAPSGDVEEARRLAHSARAKASSGDDFYLEVLWRSALALVNARELLGDHPGAASALRLALDEYERKGSVVGSQRLRAQLDATA